VYCVNASNIGADALIIKINNQGVDEYEIKYKIIA
jgi:hypothetical protein